MPEGDQGGCSAHPRARGEGAALANVLGGHVRHTPERTGRRDRLGCRSGSRRAAHPRARAGRRRTSMRLSPPPRARGRVEGNRATGNGQDDSAARVIRHTSERAGRSAWHPSRTSSVTAHPRARGEEHVVGSAVVRVAGTPPSARGGGSWSRRTEPSRHTPERAGRSSPRRRCTGTLLALAEEGLRSTPAGTEARGGRAERRARRSTPARTAGRASLLDRHGSFRVGGEGRDAARRRGGHRSTPRAGRGAFGRSSSSTSAGPPPRGEEQSVERGRKILRTFGTPPSARGGGICACGPAPCSPAHPRARGEEMRLRDG